MKRYFFLAILCFTSSLLGSAVTVIFLPEPPAEVEQAEWELPEVLQVRKVVLVDPGGRTRMVLAASTTDADAPATITLYDANGIRKLAAGIDKNGDPYLTLENSELPNPDHKRIALTIDESTATLKMGHGDFSEIELRSARPSETTENRIQLRARNSSSAAFYVDGYGHATLEVIDKTTKSILRVPEWRELIPE